jgi:hypothetical protein
MNIVDLPPTARQRAIYRFGCKLSSRDRRESSSGA